MQNEFKKLLILCFFVFLILCGIVLAQRPSIFGGFSKYFLSDECSFLPYKNDERLCLGQDAGVKSDFSSADMYCKKIGMRLSTREEAWYIWIASENCQRAFASNEYVPKNKAQFLNADFEPVQALGVKNYCNETASIKFSQAIQYNGGFFWLSDFAGGKRHYAFNYSNGVVKIFKDKTNSLGVRCVR